jgi:hypothetical protein
MFLIYLESTSVRLLITTSNLIKSDFKDTFFGRKEIISYQMFKENETILHAF